MSDNVLALIPARMGSKGIPGKNFRELAGRSPLWRAIDCAGVVAHAVVVSTDAPREYHPPSEMGLPRYQLVERPAVLAQDDTPMMAVIQHALVQIPGPDDQIILLLPPTQPLRTPEHVARSVALLQQTRADSVISVIEVTPPAKLLRLIDGCLWPWTVDDHTAEAWVRAPERRQLYPPAYQRDGTVYAFWRRTVVRYGSIYGARCVPLLIPKTEHADLDTPEDWADAERRLEQAGVPILG